MKFAIKTLLQILAGLVDILLMALGVYFIYLSVEAESLYKLLFGLWLLYSPRWVGLYRLFDNKSD